MEIKWNTLWKVCKGERNLSTKKAMIVADITGTSPMVWMDESRAHLRARHINTIAKALGIER
jgi:plasmid maintenance system antidote protein VapI